jgi:hypothetical protein
MSSKVYKDIDSLLKGEKVLLEALNLMGIKPDYVKFKLASYEPPYTTAQFTELLMDAQRERLESLLAIDLGGKNDEYKSGRSVEMSETSPVYVIDSLLEFNRTTQIEAFDMTLLMFTPEYRKFVSAVREMLQLPLKGFKDWEERFNHFKKIDEGKEGWKSASFLLTAIRHYMSLTIFAQAEPGRGYLLSTMIFDHITMDDPLYFMKEKGGPHGAYPDDELAPTIPAGFRYLMTPKRFLSDSVDITVAIYPTTTKAEVKDAIDANWKVVELLKEKLPSLPSKERLKNPASLKLTLQVYEAYLQGMNYAQICSEFKISDTRARKMVSDTKARIEELKQL